MRIVAFLSDRAGQGAYRIINPLTELDRRGHAVGVIETRPQMTICASVFWGVDVVILQRSQGIVDLLDQIPPQYPRPAVVYDIDDCIWEMPHDNPARVDYTDRKVELLSGEMRRSRAILTSTPELAHEIFRRGINRSIYVVPNGIDYDLREWGGRRERPKALEGRRVIGWAGGLHHNGDEVPLGGSLAQVLKKHPETVFCMIGNAELAGCWRRRLNIPEEQFVFVEGKEFAEYPPYLSWFDIAIAPLRDIPFNRCKSELRLMEYGAAGVPYVASRIEPFLRFHRVTEGLGGLLAGDEYEWRMNLETLLYQYEVRAGMAAAIRAQTRKHYDLPLMVDRLETALEAITGKAIERELAIR